MTAAITERIDPKVRYLARLRGNFQSGSPQYNVLLARWATGRASFQLSYRARSLLSAEVREAILHTERMACDLYWESL
jgi:hypothetical protein